MVVGDDFTCTPISLLSGFMTLMATLRPIGENVSSAQIMCAYVPRSITFSTRYR